MNRTICTWMISAVWAAGLFFAATPALSDNGLDFAVIQPGQPGSPEEARPVMDALAAYIQQKWGSEASLAGTYFNQVDQAFDFLHNRRPAWGIVSLGFYAEYARAFQMTGLAATRPGGEVKDIWRLMVPTGGCTHWKALQGTVLGNMLFEKEAAACLLFGVPADRLPFTLKGTFHPLRSLRDVVKGGVAAAVLDRVQYDALQALPLARQITAVHASEELPASPVVWFGEPDVRAQVLADILLGMKEDGNAQTLLKLLQTDGFGPLDPDLPHYRLGQEGTTCFP